MAPRNVKNYLDLSKLRKEPVWHPLRFKNSRPNLSVRHRVVLFYERFLSCPIFKVIFYELSNRDGQVCLESGFEGVRLYHGNLLARLRKPIANGRSNLKHL